MLRESTGSGGHEGIRTCRVRWVLGVLDGEMGQSVVGKTRSGNHHKKKLYYILVHSGSNMSGYKDSVLVWPRCEQGSYTAVVY